MNIPPPTSSSSDSGALPAESVRHNLAGRQWAKQHRELLEAMWSKVAAAVARPENPCRTEKYRFEQKNKKKEKLLPMLLGMQNDKQSQNYQKIYKTLYTKQQENRSSHTIKKDMQDYQPRKKTKIKD